MYGLVSVCVHVSFKPNISPPVPTMRADSGGAGGRGVELLNVVRLYPQTFQANRPKANAVNVNIVEQEIVYV